jgi:hypothetical protein
MIERAKNDGLIEGVIPHLVDGGLSILQYADDTILFMEHDLEKALRPGVESFASIASFFLSSPAEWIREMPPAESESIFFLLATSRHIVRTY